MRDQGNMRFCSIPVVILLVLTAGEVIRAAAAGPNSEFAKHGMTCGSTNISCGHNAICAKSSSTEEHTCEFVHSFRPNPEGNCVHSYYEQCLADRDCDLGFKCDVASSRCVCTFKDQIYDRGMKKCVATFGKKCQDNVWDACGANLICEKECVCPKGLIPNLNNDECRLGFNKECDVKMQHDGDPANICDSSRDLICSVADGKCKCNSVFYKYDKYEGRCLGVEGAHCDPAKNPHSCSSYFQCQQVGSSSLGYCKERDGWKEAWNTWLFWFFCIVMSMTAVCCIGVCCYFYKQCRR